MKSLYCKNLQLQLLYLISLFCWLLASLWQAEWHPQAIAPLLPGAALFSLIGQMGIMLLIAAEAGDKPASELMLMLQCLLTPLPLWLLLWLAGYAADHILRAYMLLALLAVLLILMSLATRRYPMPLVSRSALALLVVGLWNYQEVWRPWIQ